MLKSTEKTNRTASCAGIEIGSVSVKIAGRYNDATSFSDVLRHEGKPVDTVRKLMEACSVTPETKSVITGSSARELINLPYQSESECFEKSIEALNIDADILVSLGGESFSVYTLKDRRINTIISSTKCAAGTGEFIVQQFQRMGFTLQEGISAAQKGQRVALASRCSVHCKSDATHKLNKGECSPSDIACSLIHDLSEKVYKLVESSGWPAKRIILCGGLCLNACFIETVTALFPEADVIVPEQGPCLEAYGASLFAAESTDDPTISAEDLFYPPRFSFQTLPRLTDADSFLDYRVQKGDHDNTANRIPDTSSYILGVDAGSTTTKAVLFNTETRSVDASCYLRTHGNPVQATRDCIKTLLNQSNKNSLSVLNIAVTGSGREMVSVYLDNCLSYNEILTHARASSELVTDVETVFEIGGQDSKFISFQGGIPSDYAMNEGCSAGTGSFLEESLSVDLGIPVDQISDLALKSKSPISFGERCAAFINTDMRNALQQGAKQEDVVAGLVYSIADNYISRIVGTRSTGDSVIFQGGVALNRAVSLAIAGRTGKKVIVPPYPELMGCVGSALMANDHMEEGVKTALHKDLKELLAAEINIKNDFTCNSCNNTCNIKSIAIHGKTFPFGGLCSKYELSRKNAGIEPGKNLMALRNTLMFEQFGPKSVPDARGRMGLPMTLSGYEFFPFYAKLINELGYNVVLSEPSAEGNSKTASATCYPCEIAHGATFDLLKKEVDYIFFPKFIEADVPKGYTNAYSCPSVTLMPDVVSSVFDISPDVLLSPHISFSKRLMKMTYLEIEKMAASLGISRKKARQATAKAIEHFKNYKKALLDTGKRELSVLKNEPVIIIAGRSYITSAAKTNLSIDKKITSRGYHIIPQDMLPLNHNDRHPRNMWYAAQQMTNAAWYSKNTPNMHLCMMSCFSCAPDASAYHLLKQELTNEPFCYLEIDSHTAHAGFDTRIGAFLDILEENKRQKSDRKKAA